MMFQSFTLTFQLRKFTFALKKDERLHPFSEEMRSPLACRPEVGRAGSEQGWKQVGLEASSPRPRYGSG